MTNTQESKKCLYCNDEFTVTNPDKIYCSDSCRVMAHRKRKEESINAVKFTDETDEINENQTRINTTINGYPVTLTSDMIFVTVNDEEHSITIEEYNFVIDECQKYLTLFVSLLEEFCLEADNTTTIDVNKLLEKCTKLIYEYFADVPKIDPQLYDESLYIFCYQLQNGLVRKKDGHYVIVSNTFANFVIKQIRYALKHNLLEKQKIRVQ